MISGGVIGALLLFALLLRLFDGAFGMAVIFGVMMYVSDKVKQHVKAVRGSNTRPTPAVARSQDF